MVVTQVGTNAAKQLLNFIVVSVGVLCRVLAASLKILLVKGSNIVLLLYFVILLDAFYYLVE